MTKQERIELLERIVRETLWMACRYAHGRQSYAVGKYNRAARDAFDLGLVDYGMSPEPIFAIDGTLTAEMSGLMPDEFEHAWRGWSDPSCIPNHCNQKPTPRCTCPAETIERVRKGGTCGRGGCPYGGDF